MDFTAVAQTSNGKIVKKLTKTKPFGVPGSVGLPTLTAATCRSQYPNSPRFQDFTSGIRLALVTSNDGAS